MSTLCPYRIINGDDGLSVKVEWDVHYLTDEQIGMVRKYVEETEAENAKLRELVHDMYEDIVCGCAECFFSEYDEHRGKPSECGNGGCGYRQIADRMRKLGVDA